MSAPLCNRAAVLAHELEQLACRYRAASEARAVAFLELDNTLIAHKDVANF